MLRALILLIALYISSSSGYHYGMPPMFNPPPPPLYDGMYQNFQPVPQMSGWYPYPQQYNPYGHVYPYPMQWSPPQYERPPVAIIPDPVPGDENAQQITEPNLPGPLVRHPSYLAVPPFSGPSPFNSRPYNIPQESVHMPEPQVSQTETKQVQSYGLKINRSFGLGEPKIEVEIQTPSTAKPPETTTPTSRSYSSVTQSTASPTSTVRTRSLFNSIF